MKWTEILTASFGVRWGDKSYENDDSLWARELRDTVYGWRNISSEELEKELCGALRYVADMDPMPRADSAQKANKYNCRDVKTWVYRYRDSLRRQKSQRYVSGVTNFSAMLKRHILELVEGDRVSDAKLMATTPFLPENNEGFVQYSTPHVYTQEERDDVSSFLSQLIREKDA